MKELRFVLAFDHELSLGGTDSYAKNLFEPTEALLAQARALNVPVVLFTDVLCALRFKDWDREGFFTPYRQQIQAAVAAGHDVQLHLHPHWLDSEYHGGRFIPSRRYTLGAFKHDPPPNDIPGIVGRAVEFLTEICRQARADYRCLAYRGGGYHLAPETETILRSLLAQGIRIDSSIAKGMRFRSRALQIDYSDMPAEANWYIAPEGPLNRAAERGILEVPIACRPRNPVNNLPSLLKRVIRRRYAYASHGRSLASQERSLSTRLARLFPQSVWTLSFDFHAYTMRDLRAIMRHHLSRHRNSDRIICSSVSHPKYMGRHQRELLSEFVSWMRSEYGDALRFVSFQDILDA